METIHSLPLVVQLDDSSHPGDVLDVLALEQFIAGNEPFAKTSQLKRVRPEASLVPAGATESRTASDPWRYVVLAHGQGWTVKVERFKECNATVTVTATTADVADEVTAALARDSVAIDDPAEGTLEVGFWLQGAHGPRRTARSIEVHPWLAIRRNYTAEVAAAFEELVALSPATLSGRLLLFHGPTGTGKTNLVRALGHAWREWCQLECVVDPERLLGDAEYLTTATLGEDDDEAAMWHLLVLEDCDEMVRTEAKPGAGQPFSRLLNLADGMLGQGRRILVCLTTNEDLSRFHPAITRPGRCIARLEVDRFSPEEAARWLGSPSPAWPEGASLAELYAARDGRLVAPGRLDRLATGHYL